MLRIKQIEKGYKIQSRGVIEKETKNNWSRYRRAYIQVENVGNGKITCAARLTQVTRRDQGNQEQEDIDINQLNPNGEFLKWRSNRKAYSILSESIPDTVNLLVSNYRSGTYDSEMVFEFAENNKSNLIDWGIYTLRIDFLRWNGTRYIPFTKFEGILKISSMELEWIGDDEIKLENK